MILMHTAQTNLRNLVSKRSQMAEQTLDEAGERPFVL